MKQSPCSHSYWSGETHSKQTGEGKRTGHGGNERQRLGKWAEGFTDKAAIKQNLNKVGKQTM